ncbi:hypothetical protein [Tellurirhabdus rosea]|uniref:hypothetical protein n=1 Tax=Tellurirhabdus rosea TaxID=2674997 RepID=UPI0022540ABD|nr:hypothetical protein [Tellurirhabdus rosea]
MKALKLNSRTLIIAVIAFILLYIYTRKKPITPTTGRTSTGTTGNSSGTGSTGTSTGVFVSTNKPSYLSDVAFSYLDSTNEASIWFNTTADDLEFRLILDGASAQPTVSGYTFGTWTGTQNEYPIGIWNRYARLNPATPGVGGIPVGATLVLETRRASAKNNVFRTNVLTPSGDTNGPKPATLTTPSGSTGTDSTPNPEGGSDSSLAGEDYRGVQFTITTAPNLPAAPLRMYPNQADNEYTYQLQAATAAALIKRIPAFNLGGRKLLMTNPIYTNPGWDVTASRSIISRAQNNYDRLTPDRKHFFADTQVYEHAAAVAMNTGLPIELRADAARFAGTNGFAGRPIPVEVVAAVGAGWGPLPASIETAKEIGRSLFGQWLTDPYIGQAKYFIINVEQSGPSPGTSGNYFIENLKMFAGVQAGMLERVNSHFGAEAAGKIVFVPYGVATFQSGFSANSAPDGEGKPAFYARPGAYDNSVFMDTLKACEGGMAVDSYIKGIWERDFFQLDAQGRVQTEGGQPKWNEVAHNFTAGGRTYNIEALECQHAAHEYYGHFGKLFGVLWNLNGGAYPVSTTSRAADSVGIQAAAYTRHTAESMAYIANIPHPLMNQNNRPLPEWLVDFHAVGSMFLAKYYVHWAPPAARRTAPGVKYQEPDEDMPADAVFEYITKAAHRVSLVKDAVDADGKWVFFKHPYISQNKVDGEHFHQKPLVFGKLYTAANGKKCLAVYAAFPVQGMNQTTKVRLFANTGVANSSAYVIDVKGRRASLVRFQLPDNMQNVEPKDIYCAFTDLAGTARIWRGDLRENVPGGMAVPADYQA